MTATLKVSSLRDVRTRATIVSDWLWEQQLGDAGDAQLRISWRQMRGAPLRHRQVPLSGVQVLWNMAAQSQTTDALGVDAGFYPMGTVDSLTVVPLPKPLMDVLAPATQAPAQQAAG